jgi:hypothetical protein
MKSDNMDRTGDNYVKWHKTSTEGHHHMVSIEYGIWENWSQWSLE